MIGWKIRREREKVATLPKPKRRLGRRVLVLVMGTSSSRRIGRHHCLLPSRMI